MKIRAHSVVSLIATIVILSFSENVLAQNKPIDPSQALAELTVVQADRDAALEKGDLIKLRSFYAPHYVMRVGNGKALTLDEVEQLALLSARPSAIERKHTTKIQKLKMVGSDAVLSLQIDHFEKLRMGDGSVRQSAQTARQRETWTKQSNEWKLAIVEDIEVKHSAVLINGRKVSEPVFEAAPAVAANHHDEPILNSGYGLVFIYRLNDGALIKPPIYCNDAKLARLTGGSFLKIKLLPAKYSLRSDTGDPIDVVIEAKKIVFLVMKLKAGFPKGRGLLQVDPTTIGPTGYKLPRMLDLTPLGSDNIEDLEKVIVEKF